MGLEDGDEIDYFTGNRYEPPKPEINPVSKEEIEGVKDPEIVSKDDIYISPDKKRQQVKGVVDEDDMDM